MRSVPNPRRLALGASAALLALALAASPVGLARTHAAVAVPTGLSQVLAAYAPASLARGVATFDAVPTAAQAAGLASLGLSVQRMHRLPLALVYGPVSAMQAAVAVGLAGDVYPDVPIELFDTTSSDAMGAAAARAAGWTGKGVTVAVVDSGCDASHPDLADHVVHNVKLYSGEYLNLPADSSSTIVVANETGPYQNTDLGSGHGTHVAGIIAADSTSDPTGGRLGVAPDAELVCYSVGEVLFTTAVVTAYDHMLDQPDMWGIDVVNNSWGNSFQQFDPRSPVAVATKAVADNGAVVVFAAGNSGYSETEMSLNPFSQAPWVLSVAASNTEDATYNRAEFSSNGLIFDNSQAVTIGAGGHTVFTGDRIGIYHPDVAAPGDNISSTCDTAGTAVGPCPPGSNTVASGTSMASPHVAGAAAVLLQANPNLTPAQVQMALQSTADPIASFGDGPTAPFWQVGYGHVDLAAAIDAVRGRNWAKFLAKDQAAADARVLAADGFKAIRSDFWTYDAPRVAVNGVTDQRSYTAPVGAGVSHVKVALSHPSLAAAQLNGMEYTVTVKDATGRVVGTSVEAPLLGAGTAYVLVDVASSGAVLGTWTFDVSGELAASDPDTLDSESALGRMVTLTVVQLARN
ncbi:MAG TPA: S8 family serine peptidase [Candidatus Limnocylindrales bacterium]|nr:S8 family serine peptidase [Candidatus Limnocylindrales bacterium]